MSKVGHIETNQQTNHPEQLRDDSFLYTIDGPITTTHNYASNGLPPTADAGDDAVANDFDDHPHKRRRVSSFAQEKFYPNGPEKRSETNSSYNYFASSGPHETAQTATLLPPLTTTDESHGATTLPLPVEFPPPTIPFSEDTPYEQENAVVTEANQDQEAQEQPDPHKPLPEVDTESLSTKKKRGRPKKEPATDSTDTETRNAASTEDIAEPLDQQIIKKKPGRPKKQENDTGIDQIPPVLEGGVQEPPLNESTPSSKVSKSSKKKIKRSKTTSDLPNKTTGELKAESDVLWVEDGPMGEGAQALTSELMAPDDNISLSRATEKQPPDMDATKEEDEQPADEKTKAPKKRGRKRKGTTTEEPAASNTENKGVLQDISNISHAPPPQDKEKDLDTNNTKADNVDSSGVDPSDAIDAPPKTPKNNHDASSSSSGPISDASSKEANAVETPAMTTNALQRAKQTPISSTGKVPYRVGLSRRARIAPLLKVVRK